MAAINLRVTRIIVEPGGRVIVRFATRVGDTFGKEEREFRNLAALQTFVQDTLSRDTLEAIFLRLILDRQPALGNPAALEGKTLTVDTSQANWGTVG